MKKFLFFLLLLAAVYPYARDYYHQHVVNAVSPVREGIDEFAKNLNEKLPRKQGFLSYDSVAVSTGSVIFLMTDGMVGNEQLTKSDAKLRLETWRPFLIDYTCRNKSLSAALKNGVTNNVYFQFTAQGDNVGYGNIIVTPEMC